MTTVRYGAASRPSDDVSLTGGAIDQTDRPDITQLTANAQIAVISDEMIVSTNAIRPGTKRLELSRAGLNRIRTSGTMVTRRAAGAGGESPTCATSCGPDISRW